MAVAADKLPRRMTEADFLRLPEDGHKYEFVDGEAREVPTSFDHDVIGAMIVYRLMPFAAGRGFVTLSQAGFRMTGGNLRLPDVGYTRKDRLPGGKPIKGFPDFAPDLAVEIISLSESRTDMTRKVGEYFASGAQVVWHVFPEEQTVTVYTSPGRGTTYEADNDLTVDSLLPGFRCRVSELFSS